MRRLLVVLCLFGCTDLEPYRCGVGRACGSGVCVPQSGRCAEDSTSCESGLVYGDSAGELAGECAPALADPSLTDLEGTPLARYFIDEAEGSETLIDVSGYDNHLTVNPENTSLVADDQGHRGMQLLLGGQVGGASRDFEPDTSVWATELHGSQVATYELVADFGPGTGSVVRTALLLGPPTGFGSHHFIPGTGTRLSTSIDYAAIPFVYWPSPFDDVGRVVVHIVLDFTQPEPEDKFQLYIDCTRVTGTPTQLGEGVPLDAFLRVADEGQEHRLVLGNRNAFGDSEEHTPSSMQGTLYYAAIYAQAFDDLTRLNNCRSLDESDDTPRVMP